MVNRLQLKRAMLLLIVMAAAFAGLGYRLVDLQILRHDELAQLEQENTQREFWQAPRRGDILDAHGNLLATSVPVDTVCADPSLIGNEQAVIARALAPLLQMPEADLYPKLFYHVSRDGKGQMVTNNFHYVRLRRHISEQAWQKIQETMGLLNFGVNEAEIPKAQREFYRTLRTDAIFAEPDEMRVYPNGALAAQVLGFCSERDVTMDNHIFSEMIGRDGIEETFNSKLSGVAGWRISDTDRAQHELVALRDADVQPRDGLNVVLTIDSVIQDIVETAIEKAMQQHTPRSITGIVIRPATGEILAMATLPHYDPNHSETISPETRDRCITDVMEPGSTFKIVVVSGALNQGVVRLNDTFYCEHGHFAYGGRILHDAEPFGILTTAGIITKSSNIGAAKIGIKLGEDQLYDYAADYGFGERSGIPLPGEVAGILHPVKDWSKVSIAQIPMGHGVAVTRLQMAMAMAAIANDGWLMRPMLVKCLEDRDGNIVEQYAPQRIRKVISDETDKEMIVALKTVVSPEGTAPKAALKDYVVAGKTGTAQKVENGAYVSNKYVASFIGFFPADNPQVCISIVMDDPQEGHYGGEVCGPVFHEIAARCASYLNIPPDQNLQPSDTAPMVAASRGHAA
ncbi:MAG: peptidoglycan D,D-transpeptidase FtsI family protein, partial [Limisphaerales bacterium]